MKDELNEIRSLMTESTLGATLDALHKVATKYLLTDALREIDAVRSTYGYMKQYLYTGYEDPQRSSLYRELRQSAYEISSRMLEKSIVRDNRTLSQAKDEAARNPVAFEEIGAKLGVYIGELTALKGEANGAERAKYINEKLYTYRRNVFNAVYSALVLTAAEETALTDLLVSASTARADERLVICALMLAR
ncbi:MAG: hypothetical protein LUC22_06775, partial [Prevotella sp.]|nr:hypothetical protein [Prevotella sp.]